MKRLILASLLFAAPALAQQPPIPPGQKAAVVMYNREVDSHQQDLVAIFQLQDQVAALTKQAEADKKQIADLTAKVPPEKTEPVPAK